MEKFRLTFFENLNKPIPSISITLFRLVFGGILLIQTYYFISTSFIQNNITNPLILFPFIDGLEPMSEQNLIILSYIMLASNLGMLYNRVARLATFIFLLCFTYFWLLDKGYFNNHYYFISLICFLLFLNERKPSFAANAHVPRISLVALQVMIFLVYFIAGCNKINPYWLFDLQPLKHIFEVKAELTKNHMFAEPLVVFLASYSGLFFDLIVGFLLFLTRFKIFTFTIVIVFHLSNYYLFRDIGEIGLFPFLMISTLILFIPSNHLNKLFNLTNKKRIVFSRSSVFMSFVLFFLILQTIVPFRHILFNGHVDYNGVGQRFAWRMKIMYKESQVNYFITNKETKEKYAVNISTMLTDKQYNNLLYFPDLVVPLAKKIKLEANQKFNIKNAKITCEYKTAFMGRNEQLLFSPQLDLSKIQTKTLTNKWLFKLNQ